MLLTTRSLERRNPRVSSHIVHWVCLLLILVRLRVLYLRSCVITAECCIFHKQKKFGDWSDDEQDSDTECEKCQQDS